MLALKDFQFRCLEALQRTNHVLCVAPTGAGKSLVYELAVRNGNFRSVLVTPLLALGRQQGTRFREIGIPVQFGASGGPPNASGPAVWILSPESLGPRTEKTLKDWGADFLIVDECHCVLDWGQTFRPAFRKVFDVLSSVAPRKSLWLSATVSPACKKDIQTEMRAQTGQDLSTIGEFSLPPNLQLTTRQVPWAERFEAALGYCLSQTEPGIVFVQTRAASERLASLLRAAGISTLTYHAGLSDEERRTHEALLSQGHRGVIVATSAFGMGMNFPQLRWCLLVQAPPSLLFAAQALGRAGRSGLPSEGAVYWDADDFRILEWLFAGRPSARSQGRAVWAALQSGRDLREILAAEFNPNGNISCTYRPPLERQTEK